MKQLISAALCLAASLPLFSQINFQFPNTLSINSSGNFAVPSAMLDVESTSQGVLIPRMTSAQRTAIVSPATGLLVFDSSNNGFWFFNGTKWLPMAAPSLAQDCDADTRIHLEKTTDQDVIRMDLGDNNAVTVNPMEVLVLRRNAGGDNTMLELFDNSASQNTFIGEGAGNANTSGFQNTALGFHALLLNTTGTRNTATGLQALYANTTGVGNTATGFQALYLNTIGGNNTATGESTLASNTAGNGNAAFGTSALYANSTGSNNTAHGFHALFSNTTGYSNTAVGYLTLQDNTTGYANTAVGDTALTFNTTGERNTAVGYAALYSNMTGVDNTSIGYHANGNNITGSFNTAVGYSTSAGASNGTYNTVVGYSAGVNLGLTNSTALGNGAVSNASDKIRFGNTNVTVIEGNVIYTVSDGRFKSDVRQDVPGLDFILKLKPVRYRFDYPAFSAFLDEKSVDDEGLRQREQQTEMGFVAQDLEQAMRQSGIEVSNLVHVPAHEKDNYSVAYSQLVVPLVQSVQEQQEQIDNLKAQNQMLQSQLDVLRSEMQSFKAVLEMQSSGKN